MKGIMILLVFTLVVFTVGTNGCNILSLSGGGAHGAFQAGVLKKLHQQGKKWNIITGISVGSINGIGLGLFNVSNQEMGIELLETIWTNITTSDVYSWNWNPIGDQSLLNNSPLNKTLMAIIQRYGGRAKRNLLIGAVNLNTGLLRLFDQSEFSSSSRTSQIVMASSSIPVVFPPAFLDGKYYVDGGTFSNEVIRPAIKYCLNNGYDKSEISIDIIICSPPIQNITNKEIQSDYIFGLMSRSYDILSNVVANHELYTHCGVHQESYPMYIYKPYAPYPGGLLDFSHPDLVKMFNIGYNIKEPEIGKYCY